MPIEIRGNTIHLRFQVRGRKVHESTGLKDTPANRRRAQAIENQRREELNNEMRYGLKPVKVVKFHDVMEEFIGWLKIEHGQKPRTFGTYRANARSIQRFFNDEVVSAIRPGDVERLKVWRSESYGPATVRLTLAVLSKFFRYAKNQGWCAINPCEQVRRPSVAGRGRTRVVTPEEQCRYFSAALEMGKLDLHDHCRLMLLLGLRPVEVRHIRKVDVDLQKMELWVNTSKTSSGRRLLALMPEAASILVKRMEGPSPWVFPSRRRPSSPWGHCTFLRWHWTVCEAVGLDFEPYCFRHTFASTLAQLGVDLVTMASLLGHSNLKQVQHYVHISAEHKRSAMMKYHQALLPSPASGLTSPTPPA